MRRLRVIERLNSQRIARQKKNWRRGVTLAQIEERKRKHSAQLVERVFAPLFPGVDENFRVGLRRKAVSAEDQALAQITVTVQLTVEYHRDVFGFIPDGLVTAGQIDNAEPAHAQSEPGGTGFAQEEPFFIRAAVAHRRAHRPYSRFCIGIARSEGDSANPAHAIL